MLFSFFLSFFLSSFAFRRDGRFEWLTLRFPGWHCAEQTCGRLPFESARAHTFTFVAEKPPQQQVETNAPTLLLTTRKKKNHSDVYSPTSSLCHCSKNHDVISQGACPPLENSKHFSSGTTFNYRREQFVSRVQEKLILISGERSCIRDGLKMDTVLVRTMQLNRVVHYSACVTRQMQWHLFLCHRKQIFFFSFSFFAYLVCTGQSILAVDCHGSSSETNHTS